MVSSPSIVEAKNESTARDLLLVIDDAHDLDVLSTTLV